MRRALVLALALMLVGCAARSDPASESMTVPASETPSETNSAHSPGDAPAAVQAAPAGRWGARGEEIVRLVRQRFMDAERGADWAERHAGYGRLMDSEQDFVARTRAALDELQTSHVAYYTALDPEHAGLLAIFGPGLGREEVSLEHIGADIARDGTLRAVFARGPAAGAGLRRGDRVLGVVGDDLDDDLDGDVDGNGRAGFEPRRDLVGRAGRALTLRVSRDGEPLEVELVPRKERLTDVWIAALENGATIHEVDGQRVGYVPVFNCAGDRPKEAVRAAITGPLRDADALVVDLRGGWGGCPPDFVSLFDQAPPRIEFFMPDGSHEVFDGSWRGPLVVLVDEGSRSGKEAVAHAIRRHELGLLVGQRTAGAVVAGSLFPLSDGSVLYLAVADVTVDGERLEGVGVTPHVVVEDARGEQGLDPQLDEALTRAADMVRAAAEAR